MSSDEEPTRIQPSPLVESQLQVPQQLVELHGWGRAAGSRSHLARIDTISGAVSALRNAGDRGLVPRGLGRSYGDAAQNGDGAVIRCTQLDRILELDVAKGTCTVEAGVSLEMLLRVFLPLGWFPMVVPGTRHVTVGGAIASDIHGKFRHGSFADSVERTSTRLTTREPTTSTAARLATPPSH